MANEIMVVAGEESGDMHAANVIKVAQELNPNLSFFGLGSKQMEQAGVELISDLTHLSSIGFIEPLKNIFFFFKLLRKLKKLMKERQPKAVFLVDYSGFNMRVAKIADQLGIPIVNYFPPSAWVWGKWRAKKMASYGAKIPAVLPMEAEIYRQAGAEVKYVGHPIVELTEVKLTTKEFKKKHGLANQKLILLLPGSRAGEIDKLLEPMLQSVEVILKRQPEAIDFVLPVAESIDLKDLEQRVKENNLPIKLIKGQAKEAMNAADVAIAASGTATLEATCLSCPMVVIYKTARINYFLAKLLVKVSHIALPNIVAGAEIVPELLQGAANCHNIAREALAIINSESIQAKMKENLAEVKAELREENTIKEVAKFLLEAGGLRK